MENQEQQETETNQEPAYQESIVSISNSEKKKFNYFLFFWIVVSIIVLVGGYFLFIQDKNGNIENLEQNEVVNIVKEEDLTTNWKTYTNKKYEFEFKYPTKGYLLEEGSGIKSAGFTTIVSLQQFPAPIEFGAGFSLGVQNVPEETIEEYIRNLYGKEILSIEPIIFEDQEWLNVRTIDGYFEEEVSANYFTFYNDKFYRIHYFPLSLKTKTANDFKRILSTFKFIKMTTDIFENKKDDISN